MKTVFPYNVVLGRDWLEATRAVPSTVYQVIKVSVSEGTYFILRNQTEAKQRVTKLMRTKHDAKSKGSNIPTLQNKHT